MVNLSREDDLQCQGLEGVAQPADCRGTGWPYEVALDAQSLVLTSEELGEELSDGSKFVSRFGRDTAR